MHLAKTILEFNLGALALFTVFGALIFTLDDLFLDWISLWKRVGPRELTDGDLRVMAALPEKRIAILVANWHEQDVIEAMVRGNVSRIDYASYTIFLGIYPNDAPTWQAARRLEAEFPEVSVIVNDRPGPTSKGQLLNHMVRAVLKSESVSGLHYDAFLLHDSEDIIHPLSLQLLSREMRKADFVQIPVLSLTTPFADFTAGSYADEFAEAHLKSMLTREALGAAVPSAGVGTAISRQLALTAMEFGSGDLLNQKTVTEDYQLGLRAGRLGFRTHFACYYVMRGLQREYVATREFFPHEVGASIRQKTRWVVGIAFQSWRDLGWGKSAIENYFLWRDRRGPFNALLLVCGALLLLTFVAHWAVEKHFPDIAYHSWFAFLCWLNFAQMLWRIAARMRHTQLVYGFAFCLLAPARWLVGNYINCMASWRAYHTYRASQKKGHEIAWVKTQHRLPLNFGQAEHRARKRDLEKQEHSRPGLESQSHIGEK